jgi:hypothetical protein
MPSFTNHWRQRIEYATEEELLDFANKVRAAGEGDALEALFPSTPGAATACLIAKALNFKCAVSTTQPLHGANLKRGESAWAMVLGARTSRKKARAIADAVECPLVETETTTYSPKKMEYIRRPEYSIRLPRKIGNTADAFDNASRGWIVAYRDQPIDD